MWKKYGKLALKVIVSVWLLRCVAGFFKDMLGISFEVRVPECGSKDITKTELIHLIDNMPLMQENSITALYVDNASEVTYNENKQTRTCTAVVKLSNTELAGIKYELYLREKELYIWRAY